MAELIEDEAKALRLVTRALIYIRTVTVRHDFAPGPEAIKFISELADAAYNIPADISRQAPAEEILRDMERTKRMMDLLRPETPGQGGRITTT